MGLLAHFSAPHLLRDGCYVTACVTLHFWYFVRDEVEGRMAMRKVGKIEPVGLSAPGASASSPMLAAQGRPSMTLDGQAARLASLQYDLETTLEIVGVLRDRVCGPASASDAAFAPSSHPDGLVALVEHRIDLIRGLQERIDTAIAEIARAIG